MPPRTIVRDWLIRRVVFRALPNFFPCLRPLIFFLTCQAPIKTEGGNHCPPQSYTPFWGVFVNAPYLIMHSLLTGLALVSFCRGQFLPRLLWPPEGFECVPFFCRCPVGGVPCRAAAGGPGCPRSPLGWPLLSFSALSGELPAAGAAGPCRILARMRLEQSASSSCFGVMWPSLTSPIFQISKWCGAWLMALWFSPLTVVAMLESTSLSVGAANGVM